MYLYSSEAKLDFEIGEIYLADSYLDGGSYLYQMQTTDNRGIYIFMGRAGGHDPENNREIAYLNSMDLTENTDLFSDVLVAMDARFRSVFDVERAYKLDVGPLIEEGDEDVLRVLMLSNILQEGCAGLISFISAELTGKAIDCSFYLPDDYVVR